jgi:hypothetical protein
VTRRTLKDRVTPSCERFGQRGELLVPVDQRIPVV